MIGIGDLQDLFDATREHRTEGRARFDIDDVCRWSFFFIDADRTKLALLASHLQELGYEFRGYLEPSGEDDDQETIYLRVDRVEKHTVDSLHARNLELYAIAEEFDVLDYDGMDVGAVDGP